MEFTLKPASPKDYITIQQLAIVIWNKHYVPIIGQKQVDYMLDKLYSEKGIAEQVQDKAQSFLLILNVSAKAVGFIAYSPIAKGEYWLNKFYILNEEQGKGFGTEVFKEFVKHLNKPEKVKLTVNRQNYKSINFYFKNGFVIEEVADLILVADTL